MLKRLNAFLSPETTSGLLLVGCTLAALALANSPAKDAYWALLHSQIGPLSLQHWINDGLMTIFFFVVGMEIKRELTTGELSSPRRAALPIAAAMGGMIAPALLYLWHNPTYPGSRGWGIPMATDIAFAIGALSFFGKRVPLALKIFLLALAIVDDLGAVLVIAFFYTTQIIGPFLGLAAGGLCLMVLARKAGIRAAWMYIPLGILVWFGVLRSGVHATIAGVLIGFITPTEVLGLDGFYSPIDHLVKKLHPYMSFLVMPVFALANAGVSLAGAEFAVVAADPVFRGVALGLVAGKPIGILLACGMLVALGLAELPRGVTWLGLTGVSLLGGIGFTMALFISSLALYPEQEIFSKSGILLGSLAAALAGMALLSIALRPRNPA